MSATLIATPADYCQTLNGSGLRGRRFSVNPPLPQNLFASARSDDVQDAQNESAIEEDDSPLSIELPQNDFARAIPALPAPLTNVHMSGYSTNVYIPRHQNGGGPLGGPTPSGSSTPFVATPASEFPPSTPVDRSGSIIHLIGGEPIACPTPSQERVKRRLACAYFLFFLCGWGDGVTGTVLPYLKAYFHLSDLLISTLWLGGTVGFFLGTFIVEPAMHSLGLYQVTGAADRSLRPAWSHRGKMSVATVAFSASQSRYLTLVLGCIVHSSFFVLMGIRKGFGAMFVAYATAALARAFLTGIGGVFAPLVCQSIIASGAPWQNFYYGSLVVSALNLALVMYAFKPTQREQFTERKEALSNASPRSAPGTPAAHDDKTMTFPPTPSTEANSSTIFRPPPSKPENTFRKALSFPYTWAVSLFGLLYYGSDTIAQGYIVSYLLAARRANPKTVGYVTSGYAGGLSVGRLAWGYFSPKMTFTQQKHTLTAFICMRSSCRPYQYSFAELSIGIALAMHITIWTVDSSLLNSIATAVIGLVYGPVWPGALTYVSLILPGDTRMMVMAIFSAAGNLGSSVFPPIIGAMSGAKGIQTMPYLTVPLTVSFLALWAMFPSRLPTRSSPN
ncbi:hypothetical protein V5O48_009976 [Marasmius crinis-equi]|uniref:Major facilitator superfamily (MFS) profile domain-containing protein n=1 Tax=Marasmius crinis-equi TaxID=585013 RepID=A0ABR3FA41_9AGAR